jgi:YYY domain-containing protein
MDQVLLAFRWYLVVQGFGFVALPVSLRVFRHLPDAGYGVSKPLGLLLSGWIFWILTSLGWTRNTEGGIIVAQVALLAAGVALHLAKQSINDPGTRSRTQFPWHSAIAVEVVFALGFVSWCLVRAHMPRIQTAGGEKWMEIAFLQAILRSTSFPPHDPWLSGFAISYYYFGYVIVAMIARLAAVQASIAFNLAIATLFALTCTGAFGMVYNLIIAGNHRRDTLAGSPVRAIWGGLLGPLLVAVMGNLEGLLEVLHARGIGPAMLWAWLDIRNLDGPPPPVAEGSWLPTRFFWWWQASRVLRDYDPLGTAQEVIDEFPAFSFILGDMHPHVLALPFILLALALALNLYLGTLNRATEDKTGRRTDDPPDVATPRFLDRLGQILRQRFPLTWWEFCVYALCLGGLGFLNTWDFPIYLFTVAAAYTLARLGEPRRMARLSSSGVDFTILFMPLLVVGVLLYLPFWIGFQSQAGGVLINLFSPTRLPQFFVMFAPLIVLGSGYVVECGRQSRVQGREVIKWTLITLLSVLGILLLVLGVAVVMIRANVIPAQGAMSYLATWLRGGSIPHLEDVVNARGVVADRLLLRLINPWVAMGLLAFLVTIVMLVWNGVQPDLGQSRELSIRKFILLLLAVGGLLTVSVEFVYLRDVFMTRMNTVFKFYFQAWVMWAIAGGYILFGLFERVRGSASVDWVDRLALACASMLVLAGLVYPALAVAARAGEYGGPPTLDGTAYLADLHPDDYAAITWLNSNVGGAPIILEAPGDKFRAYVYEGRISALTGLPTLLGWAGHEQQWRGKYDEQSVRESVIDTLYTSVDLLEVLGLLDEYCIRYVYVGPLEKASYPSAGLAKFGALMDTVYDTGAVTIYYRPIEDPL